ncbi:hypothetical protein I0C86_15320 [Plantactinospora sp. S1510]|uniref:TraD/TraG TraM recognition site domain-containing protein n=1 Tax=Plantactinospora alkalitolerans TaxID=2789879 RepID=A0ABS0GVU7_9ACTN|nr:hypothetical protein [Plantactinospora alkalitolerans]MBF9130315.1 hypothetical protein [Plantactinospora alkalitolerans]
MSGTYRMATGAGPGLRPVVTTSDGWSAQLVPRLFAPPARWGWQAAPVPVPAATLAPPPPRPAWTEPPRPDTSALVAARSKAVSRVLWRLAFAVVAAFAFTTYQLVIEQQVGEFGDSARQVYKVTLIVVAALLALGVIRAVGGVRYANRNIHNFEQPYLVLRAAEQERHRQALQSWERVSRQHTSDAESTARAAAAAASGPRWYPVYPASEPIRVDVFGGDPRRLGWASLLVTAGASLLSAGHRITVLDFTGQEVGENLVKVAHAAGMPTRTLRLDGHEVADVQLLSGLDPREIAECLGHALTGRQDGDRREERALAIDLLRRVIGSLDGPVLFARMAAGMRVLRQGTGDGLLSDVEIGRLAAHLGDVDQTEWTTRQLGYLAHQLDLLHEVAPASVGSSLWADTRVNLIATEGGRGDRKEQIDRTLVRLARTAMDGRRWISEFLVVAGADHLGAAELQMLSEHARAAKVRLVLMIDQPQGDLEKSAGLGGAVCFMKLYNHRDASVAAEFIGKEHRFVLNQLTRQVGSTFTDGGGDSFAANTSGSGNSKQRRSGTPGRPTGLSDSRGHAWTGTRNWSNADNVSTSTGSGRVYEFKIDPEQLLGMPETAFVLVDNSGQGRRVILADCNPGLCQLDRVSAVPAR